MGDEPDADSKHHREIERQIKADEVKLLLLGKWSSAVGGSRRAVVCSGSDWLTEVRKPALERVENPQMKLIHASGFTKTDRWATQCGVFFQVLREGPC